MPLGSKSGGTILGSVLNRLEKAKYLDEVIIATTTNDEDDPIVAFANNKSVKVFRGSENDVLSRYYLAAIEHKLDKVVRITSDCPFIDPEVVDLLVESFDGEKEYDYMSNTLDRTYPRGLDCEIMTLNALKRAYEKASDVPSREHVTYYIYNPPEDFKVGGIMLPTGTNHSDVRITVDTKQDYALACVLQDLLPENSTSFWDIIDILSKRPYLRYINEDIQQKER
jgi:spore coat polysaccharide biosynthesis protein SpsF